MMRARRGTDRGGESDQTFLLTIDVLPVCSRSLCRFLLDLLNISAGVEFFVGAEEEEDVANKRSGEQSAMLYGVDKIIETSNDHNAVIF